MDFFCLDSLNPVDLHCCGADDGSVVMPSN